MSVPEELFDEDYLYFYADVLGAERSDGDAELIARLLDLKPGIRVLDVPCGEGRISGRLAARGCDVVGIDATARFVGLARTQYPTVAFELGDMRALPYEAEFDAAINWFTSFGYFEPEVNDQVLAGFARALRPGGRLLLELLNPWRLARLVEVGGGSSAWVMRRGDDLSVDRVVYDQIAGRSTTERFIARDGKVRTVEFSMEQVPAPQLVRRLRRVGFGEVQLFGDGGEPFTPQSRRLMAVATLGPAEEPPVSLREVTRDNVRSICDLAVAPGQEPYVAPNSYTLVEAELYGGAWVRAIYAGETPVGLLAVIEENDRPHWLARFMIGAQHQGRGYGHAAVRLLVEHAALTEAPLIETSCVPGPGSPADFYRSLGFRDTGRLEHDEEVLRLEL